MNKQEINAIMKNAIVVDPKYELFGVLGVGRATVLLEEKNTQFINVYATLFGIRFDNKVTYSNLLESCKTGLTESELEDELNQLAHYVFSGRRAVIFHENRNFPYIQHGDRNTADSMGLAKNYMCSDYYFIQFIKLLLWHNGEGYCFPSTKYIVQLTSKIPYTDYPLTDMPIDVLIK